MADLYPPRADAIAGNGHSKRIVATYDYRDERGGCLYQVVRFEPKGFAQRRPDGNGGWIWNLDGVRQVPYRLPELLAADPDEWVLIVEGEKDADRLAGFGLGRDDERRRRAQMAGRVRVVFPRSPGRDHPR